RIGHIPFEIGKTRQHTAINTDRNEPPTFHRLRGRPDMQGGKEEYLFGDDRQKWILVDTLYVSPSLFPERQYLILNT
ncbi:MAG: hypothetical protein K2I52_04210, partial [Muribaculaceae bacterium]|nr:hypothetical protein [Muribaculaceae bacterium]